ncbi:MAG: PAS domain S-box protein [Verrucomicrobia bacterium]|nr:MAG: PAS domain S-box protein [Verrucomicrobiota bacterium]
MHKVCEPAFAATLVMPENKRISSPARWLAWWLWLAWIGSLTGGSVRSWAASPITTANDFYTLSPREARQAVRVQIEGVWLYGDPDWRIAWVQDRTGILFFAPPRETASLQAGDRVLVTGRTAWSEGGGVVLADAKVRRLGAGTWPEAVPLTQEVALGKTDAHQPVATTGVIRRFEPGEGRLRLELAIAFGRLQVYVRDPGDLDPATLQDARVRIEGVAAPVPESDAKPGLLPVQLFVPDATRVTLLRRGLADPFAVPLTTIRDLQRTVVAPHQAERYRLQGHILELEQGRSVLLADRTGQVRVLLRDTSLLREGNLTEVSGFPARTAEGTLLIEDAVARPLMPPGLSRFPRSAPLTNVAVIRELKLERAAAGLPVAVQGVVTYHDPEWRVLFIQQGEAGIYVDSKAKPLNLKPGDRVRVEGVTSPGGYAPIIAYPTVTRLGEGSLPEPAQVTARQLIDGRYDARFVELEGVIRRIELQGRRLRLWLSSDGLRLEALITPWEQPTSPENWLGQTAVIQGAVGGRFNARRQMLGAILHVPGASHVHFPKPLPEDPFAAAPRHPISRLLTHASGAGTDELVRVRGVVTAVLPDGWMAVQDPSGGLLVKWPGPPEVPVGRRVEILGFPAMGGFSPTLEEPRLRLLEPEPLPKPEPATVDVLQRGLLDARRVTLQARLLENHAVEARPHLVLEQGAAVFRLELGHGIDPANLARVRRGSRLEVTGVCQVLTDDWNEPRGFRLLLGRAEDLKVLAGPPLLSADQIQWAAGILGGGILLALAWVWLLRRKVEQQTRLIRRQFQTQLELRQRLAALFETAGDPMFLLDNDGRITEANRAAAECFGRPLETLRGTPLADWFAPGDRPKLAETLQAIAQGQVPGPIELETTAPEGGTPRRLEVNLRPLTVDGRPEGFQCIGRDLTARRQLQARLAQVQRMQAVAQLAGGVAHDFNNLLAGILAHTEMALETTDAPLPPGLEPHLREIQHAARRCSELTSQLLAFARKQPVQPRRLQLNAAVAEILQHLRPLLGGDVELTWLPGNELPEVRLDPNQIRQLLTELILNARDATEGVGRITVRTEAVTLTQPLAAHPKAAPGVYLRLSVSDNGRGMDTETLQRVFDPFYTTKEPDQGSGLGLATVAGIAEQNGGWAEAESQPGQGSTFHVYFPAADRAASLSGSRSEKPKAEPPPSPETRPGEQTPPAAGALPLAGRTILLVDDEPAVLKPAAIALRRQGCEVLTASRPEDALRLAAQHAGPIDLLVTDVVMPQMNGRDLADRLRADRPDLRVLYMSGYTRDVLPEVAGEGDVPFLAKPFALKTLVAKVQEVVADAAARA